MTPTPDVTTADSDTLTVQQLDHLAKLLRIACHAPGLMSGDDPWDRYREARYEVVQLAPALLATVRRQKAALDAVTELADALDIDAAEEAVLSEGDGLDPYEMERKLGLSQGIQSSADALRAALASPAPTEATT